MRHLTILSLTLVILATACSRRPTYVIPEDKMTDLLYDIQLAQGVYGTQGQDYAANDKKDALVNGVLAKYQVTQAELDTSLLWYADNMSIYKSMNDTIAARLRRTSDVLRKEISQKALGRSVRKDMLIPPIAYLNSSVPILSFVADSVKLSKSVSAKYFNLSFDVQGLSDEQKAVAGVFFRYADTTIYKITPINKNTHYTFSKPMLPDSLLKSISGYIRLQKARLPNDIAIYNIQYNDSLSTAKKGASDNKSESTPALENDQRANGRKSEEQVK